MDSLADELAPAVAGVAPRTSHAAEVFAAFALHEKLASFVALRPKDPTLAYVGAVDVRRGREIHVQTDGRKAIRRRIAGDAFALQQGQKPRRQLSAEGARSPADSEAAPAQRHGADQSSGPARRRCCPGAASGFAHPAGIPRAPAFLDARAQQRLPGPGVSRGLRLWALAICHTLAH